jgi:hypothetical protein
MSFDPETQARIDNWRRRSLAGEVVPLEEMKAAIILIRGGRRNALEASLASGKSKAKAKPARSADDMLADFES